MRRPDLRSPPRSPAGPAVGCVELRDVGPVALADVDDAKQRQGRDPLAQRTARDSQGLGEFLLDGQPVPGSEHPLEDHPLDTVDHFVSARHATLVVRASGRGRTRAVAETEAVGETVVGRPPTDVQTTIVEVSVDATGWRILADRISTRRGASAWRYPQPCQASQGYIRMFFHRDAGPPVPSPVPLAADDCGPCKCSQPRADMWAANGPRCLPRDRDDCSKHVNQCMMTEAAGHYDCPRVLRSPRRRTW